MIGSAPRDVIHREGHMHRSVHMLLLDSRGRVFVQRRSPDKDTNPDLWDSSAAGHVDSGESCPDAAVRELAEELGVHVGTDALVRTGGLLPHEVTGLEFVEIYRVVSDAPLTLQVAEIADGRWVSQNELALWLTSAPEAFTDIFRDVWASARPRSD